MRDSFEACTLLLDAFHDSLTDLDVNVISMSCIIHRGRVEREKNGSKGRDGEDRKLKDKG